MRSTFPVLDAGLVHDVWRAPWRASQARRILGLLAHIQEQFAEPGGVQGLFVLGEGLKSEFRRNARSPISGGNESRAMTPFTSMTW